VDGTRQPPPLSPVVVSGDLVYVSGQVGLAPDGRLAEGFEAQCRQVFANLQRLLESVGCGFRDAVKVNGYLLRLTDFDSYNRVYREYFSEPYPARTTVGADLLPGFLVEVDLVARRAGR
jgi:2-iminobutanoate/2-iminopropanoate deaminase